MAISNYTNLKTAISTWTAQDDVSSNVDDLIDIAEAYLNRTLAVKDMLASVSDTVPSDGAIDLPEDYIQNVAITVSASAGDITLMYLDPKTFLGSEALLASGFPRYYTILGSELRVAPIPDSATAYTYELFYLAKIPALSATTTTNWLLTKAPDLYLYACLAAAGPYLKDQSKTAEFQAHTDRIVRELQGLDMRATMKPGGRSFPDAPGKSDAAFRRW